YRPLINEDRLVRVADAEVAAHRAGDGDRGPRGFGAADRDGEIDSLTGIEDAGGGRLSVGVLDVRCVLDRNQRGDLQQVGAVAVEAGDRDVAGLQPRRRGAPPVLRRLAVLAAGKRTRRSEGHAEDPSTSNNK